MVSEALERDRESIEDLQPVNVLIVDDRAQDLTALRLILSDPTYNVVAANSGTEALRRVLEQDFAVILLDVIMPTLDGFELASLIKQREHSRDTPIIFLTAASIDLANLYQAYSVGAIDYLVKPVDPDIVRAKVGVFAQLFRKDRRLRRYAEMLRDSERRQRELEVAQLRLVADRRYHNLADAVPQIVWTADAKGHLDYCNRRWIEYTGLSLSQSRGRGWLVAVHPSDVKALEHSWHGSVHSGVDCELEVRLRRAHDGAYRWHQMRAIPERDEDGSILAWLGTHSDIEQLIAAIRARDEFLSIASHELRTPLTALKLRVQGLQRDRSLAPEVVERVASVERQAERLEKLVDNLLDVARIVSGQLGLQPEEVVLAHVAYDIVERFRANAEPNTPDLELEVVDDVSGFWDKIRIEQVLTNLLTNAIRHSERKPVRVTISADEHGARLTVADLGRGIAPEDQIRIFERFGRVGGPREQGGLGLGLYITSQIVEAHAGTICVESRSGHGARFVVTLPYSAVERVTPTPVGLER